MIVRTWKKSLQAIYKMRVISDNGKLVAIANKSQMSWVILRYWAVPLDLLEEVGMMQIKVKSLIRQDRPRWM